MVCCNVGRRASSLSLLGSLCHALVGKMTNLSTLEAGLIVLDILRFAEITIIGGAGWFSLVSELDAEAIHLLSKFVDLVLHLFLVCYSLLRWILQVGWLLSVEPLRRDIDLRLGRFMVDLPIVLRMQPFVLEIDGLALHLYVVSNGSIGDHSCIGFQSRTVGGHPG